MKKKQQLLQQCRTLIPFRETRYRVANRNIPPPSFFEINKSSHTHSHCTGSSSSLVRKHISGLFQAK